jgi:outer membrane biosynthesis protein TonB
VRQEATEPEATQEPVEEPRDAPVEESPEVPAEEPTADEPASSPVIPDDSEPEPTPEPAAEPEPAWQPEPHTVYILDGDGDIYLQSTTDDAEHFRSLVSAWSGAAESYNVKQNKPGPYPYSFVAGDPPEGYD